ncbi:MAG: hypothetical protein JXQ69_07325 [Paludibacteraceae bacterium]|nr:hypothetical protein [Paludibacteraceae bacterium]MBN2788115.1 hypothetical protein [Paludibacteraceae bacterium]
MKLVIKILLGISIALLGYFSVMSIVTPIKFEETRTEREKAVIASLINLRKAELEFKNQYGRYTASMDTLLLFLKNGKMKTVKKVGTLTDEQLEKGLTEAKALAIVKKGNAKEIAENGLQGFSRDTAYSSIIETLFKGEYDENTIDNIGNIPFSNGKKFEMEVGTQVKNAVTIPLFEIRAHYDTFLEDLNKQERINLIDLQEKLDKYPGLKVGSVSEPSTTGNWES